jgi:hypothetical protein
VHVCHLGCHRCPAEGCRCRAARAGDALAAVAASALILARAVAARAVAAHKAAGAGQALLHWPSSGTHLIHTDGGISIMCDGCCVNVWDAVAAVPQCKQCSLYTEVFLYNVLQYIQNIMCSMIHFASFAEYLSKGAHLQSSCPEAGSSGWGQAGCRPGPKGAFPGSLAGPVALEPSACGAAVAEGVAALLTNHLSLELIHCHGTLHPCTNVFFQWLPLSVITQLMSMNDMPFID